MEGLMLTIEPFGKTLLDVLGRYSWEWAQASKFISGSEFSLVVEDIQIWVFGLALYRFEGQFQKLVLPSLPTCMIMTKQSLLLPLP